MLEFWSEHPDEQLDDMATELAAGGPSHYRVALLDSRPVGLLFYYRIHDYPEYVDELTQAGLTVPETAWSMDYLVGEPDAVGRGVATEMIRLASAELWTGHPDAARVLVPVHADNAASWRALARAGFTRLPGTWSMEPDNPRHTHDHIVHVLDRPRTADEGDTP